MLMGWDRLARWRRRGRWLSWRLLRMREGRNVSLTAEVEPAYDKAAKLTWTQSHRLDFYKCWMK